MSKDGQTTPTANQDMDSYKHTSVGNASARDQYARNVPADSDKLMPWWVYAGWIGPMIFVAAQVYLYR
jgi:hypothetical protein